MGGGPWAPGEEVSERLGSSGRQLPAAGGSREPRFLPALRRLSELQGHSRCRTGSNQEFLSFGWGNSVDNNLYFLVSSPSCSLGGAPVGCL